MKIVLLLVFLFLLALAAAVVLVALAVILNRKKNQRPKKELDPSQVDEIVSTWTLNH